MNYAAIAAELRGAPIEGAGAWALADDELHSWCWHTLSGDGFAIVLEIAHGMTPGQERHPFPLGGLRHILPDACSEAAEMCERLAAIESCGTRSVFRPKAGETHVPVFWNEHGLMFMQEQPIDGCECANCPAEYHQGRWL